MRRVCISISTVARHSSVLVLVRGQAAGPAGSPSSGCLVNRRTSGLAQGRARQLLRAAGQMSVGKLGYRLEPLVDLRNFVEDDATNLPTLSARFTQIPGMIDERRCMYYYWLSYSCSVPGDIVEIGVWQGRSTVFFAQGAEDSGNGVVHAVDTFAGNPGNEGAYEVQGVPDLESGFRANIARSGLTHRVVVHAGRSADLAEEVRRGAEAVRILCIDGEHTYGAVAQELDLYADLVVPGGLLVLDDYSKSFPGVAEAFQEHLARNPGRYARPVQDRNLAVVARRR
jgi:predicted O-methyltransferase YrrM